MTDQVYANNAKASLNTSITDTALTFTVSSGGGATFPVLTGVEYFLVTLYEIGASGEQNHEIIKVSARVGDTFTVASGGRGQEGTVARAYSSGTAVELRITKGTLDELKVTSTSVAAASGVIDTDFVSNGLLKRTALGAYSVVTDNSANWNTAYGWGDHSGLYALASHVHDAAEITSGVFNVARISQSSVTQHQASLSIASSQVSGTFAGFASAGITDNATATALTIDASQNATFAGDVTIASTTPSLFLGDATLTTGAARLEIGGNRTGDGISYIDMHSSISGATTYDSRIIRSSGVNGGLDIINKGTGSTNIKVNNTEFALSAHANAQTELYYNNVLAFETNNTGIAVKPSGNATYAGVSIESAGTHSSYIFFTNTTNGTQSRITSIDGGDLWFSTDNGITQALTLDSSNNAKFAGTIGVGIAPVANVPLKWSMPTGAGYLNMSAQDMYLYCTTGAAYMGTTFSASTILVTNNTAALTISATQNSTFAGDVNMSKGDVDTTLTLGGTTTNARGILNITGGLTTSPFLAMYQGGNQRAYIQYLNAGGIFRFDSDNNIQLRTNNTPALTIDSFQDSDFYGTVTVNDSPSVLALNDDVAATDTLFSDWVSFQRGGVEKGWFGFGATTNLNLTMLSSIGPLNFFSNNTLALTLDNSQNATFESNVTLAGAAPYLALGSSSVSTGNAHIEIGVNRTGDGYSFIDLHSSSSPIDYDARLIRNPGVNGTYELVNVGTGDFNIRVNTSQYALKAVANGAVHTYHNNVIAFESASTGMTVKASSNATYAGITVLANTTNYAYVFFNNATTGELSRIKVNNNREFIVSNDNGVTNHLRVDGNGFVFASYFNTSPDTVTSGVTKVCVETGNDGYIRHGSDVAVRTFIGMKVLQVAYAQYFGTATGTSLIPIDGTPPTSTEGTQFMTKVITPKVSGSYLRIDVSIHLTASVAGRWMSTALFYNTNTYASAASDQYLSVAGETNQMNFSFFMYNNSLANKTFSVRAGCNASATTRFNVNHFGSVYRSSLAITEFLL